MGWADCGTDRDGRPIGYGHSAICDTPGCGEKIDRGLAFACGGFHGEGELSCERYFCDKCLSSPPYPDDELWDYIQDREIGGQLCRECMRWAIQNRAELLDD